MTNEEYVCIPLGMWQCPKGCKGSYYFTIGTKDNVQISHVSTCGMCGAFEGWRTDDDKGNKVQLSELSHEDYTRE